MKPNTFRNLAKKNLVVLSMLLAVLAVSGCHKKKHIEPEAAPPEMVQAPQPVAELTASPATVMAGDQVILSWRTTNATDVSIDGIGAVPSSGTKSVTPGESTKYHLVARGEGGQAEATATVTVTSGLVAPTPQPTESTLDDTIFHQNVADVFFDYDSYDINENSAAIVTRDAAYLVSHSTAKVVVGGYCDERGSDEYNLALGEKRADAVKQALVSAGVSPDRIRTISYGKEKPYCNENSETCWSQNRRASFTLDK